MTREEEDDNAEDARRYRFLAHLALSKSRLEAFVALNQLDFISDPHEWDKCIDQAIDEWSRPKPVAHRTDPLTQLRAVDVFKPKKSRHEFYVYYAESNIYARRGTEPAILAETCASPQAAHDKVQTIVNPSGKPASAFGPLGYHEEVFQAAISENCRSYVEAAYARVTSSQES